MRMNVSQNVSIFEPLRSAWNYTRRMLFEPFDFKKWLIIGFSCFLANLATYTNSGGNFSSGGTDSSGASGESLMSVLEEAFGAFASAVLGIGLVLILLIVVLAIALSLAMLWVGCRGTFMFIDNIARNEAAVTAPWKKYARQGWQLFYLYLAGAASLIAVIIAGIVPFVLMSETEGWSFDSELSSVALILVISLFAILVITFSVLMILVKGIVIPRMYVQQYGVLPALRDGWNLFCEYPLEWIAYIFVSIGLAIASIVLVLTFCLFTCCIGVLPYINQVAMLPMYVFIQAYTLYFIAQFGPGWNAFKPLPPALTIPDAT